MINKVYWKTVGNKNYHLVLVHGWGLNMKVWNVIIPKLVTHFTLHLVDLPGFGLSYNFNKVCIEDMAKYLLKDAPDEAIWLGWSLGGLVAMQVALTQPKRVKMLITVASSPCFSARKDWPGISSDVLANFQYQLNINFYESIERFLIIQTLGTKTFRQDIRILKDIVFSAPINVEAFKNGLKILSDVDLRISMAKVTLPYLRIYGYFDSLVPYKISELIDTHLPKSKSLIMKKASHVPFLSHPKEFCSSIITLTANI